MGVLSPPARKTDAVSTGAARSKAAITVSSAPKRGTSPELLFREAARHWNIVSRRNDFSVEEYPLKVSVNPDLQDRRE